MTKSANVLTQDSGSSRDKCVTWSHYLVSMDSDRSIEYKRMTSEGSTAERSVGVSESQILVELENRKVWQSFGEPWEYDFYLYLRPFPGA